MSAPPIAITMCTPNKSAIALININGIRPCWMVVAWTNWYPNQTTSNSPTRFSPCRAGSNIGLPLMRPDNLPNAITEPDNVTAPISTPT